MKATVQVLTQENIHLNSEVSRLSTGLNSLFQDKLSNNLTVSGVPAADGENLEKVFIKIASLLNVDLSSSDFKVKRITSKVNNKFSNLLVEFNDIKFKSTLLKNKKNIFFFFISLLPSKLGFDSDKREILFFHQLKNQNIHLLAEARKLRSNYNFKFIWYQNNQILARKAEKSKILSIRSIAELDGIINSIKEDQKKESSADSPDIIEVDGNE